LFARWPIRLILGFWGVAGGAKFPKMGDSLLWMPMNRRAKFGATNFVVGGDIRNRTNTHTRTHTQTNKQTVTAV